MRIYRILARLLAYPEAELIAALPDLRGRIAADASLVPSCRQGLLQLCDALGEGDLIEIQERYVALFDRMRSLSLHLFEHVHGDSRDRGMAMVSLIELYRQHGLDIDAQELPDYLPLLLEFLSIVEPAEARTHLQDAAHILAGLQERLAKRGSPYAAIFATLLALAEATDVAPAQAAEDDQSLEALDRAWEEVPVTFGPDSLGTDAQSCPKAATMLSRMNRS
jgi:nitrate reductase delta subunit